MSIPDLLWAQDKENVHITIQQTNCSDVDIKLNEDSINIKFNSIKDYDCNLLLGGKIDLENSSWENNRNIKFTLKRKESEYWSTLLKNNAFKNKIKTDWSRWVDEDESDDEMGGMPSMPGGMDMQAMMQNMGGMEGLQNMMGGMGGIPPGMEGMSQGMDEMPEMNEEESMLEEGKEDVSGILNNLEKKEENCCDKGSCSNDEVDCNVETKFKDVDINTNTDDVKLSDEQEPKVISI